MDHEGCHETVSSAWRYNCGSSPMVNVAGKIRNCQNNLRWWSKQHFGNITRQIGEKKKLLKQAENLALQGANFDTVQQIKHEINALLVAEEKLWLQRSKSHWIASGDKNTSYFHSKALHRFRRNNIHGLRDQNNVMCTGDENVSKLLVEFYTNLFTSSKPSEIDKVCNLVQRTITDNMNAVLGRTFTREEVNIALSQMAPLKASRPDGMPPIFFQHYWGEIGSDVADAVLSCLNSDHIPPGINHTFITIIPKVKSPEKVTEFHPIALCNIVYKLISKVLANRLK